MIGTSAKTARRSVVIRHHRTSGGGDVSRLAVRLWLDPLGQRDCTGHAAGIFDMNCAQELETVMHFESATG